MNTRLTTAAVAVLISTLALGGCGTRSVDDAEPTAPPVNSIGYGNYAPRGSAPDRCLDDVHSRVCHRAGATSGGGTSDRVSRFE